MEEYMKKLKEEAQKQKELLVDHMYRKTFQEMLLNYNEYVESNVDSKLKLRLLNSMETYFVNLEEYEKCELIVRVKNRINEKSK